MEENNTSLASRIPTLRYPGPRPLPPTAPRHAHSQPCLGTNIAHSSRHKRPKEELHVSDVPRSRLSCPWLLEVPTSGYTAPPRPVYAAVVSLGSEGGRPPGYYAPQMVISTAPLGLPSRAREKTAGGGSGGSTYLKNINFSGPTLLEAFTSQPRCRRTMCVAPGFSLPSLQEEDGSPYLLRSSSVVMGTQAFSMNTRKVNNIEKAEKMKTLSMRNSCDNGSREEVRHNIENSRKIRAIEDQQGCLKTKDDPGDKEAVPDLRSL